MKRCGVKPYEGQEAYLFVSYSHRDKKRVLPMIEQLARDGYRVWYDEGIDPGTEWPEVIAHHLNRCAVCIAFLTENALSSYNCRREINFAFSKKKALLPVMLEPAQLSLGMEMQLSAVQVIFKYALRDDEEFFAKLYKLEFMQQCLGAPDPSIEVSSAEEYESNLKDLYGIDERKRGAFSDRWFIEGKNGTLAYLLRNRTNEQIDLSMEELIFGRSGERAGYVIKGNSAVSKIHAKIIQKGKNFYLTDCGSVNKTYLNAQELLPECEYMLHDGDFIRFANEKFIFRQMED